MLWVLGSLCQLYRIPFGAKVRLLRDDVVIHEGTLKTLKRHQDEVKEVKEGMECGMAFESYDDITVYPWCVRGFGSTNKRLICGIDICSKITNIG